MDEFDRHVEQALAVVGGSNSANPKETVRRTRWADFSKIGIAPAYWASTDRANVVSSTTSERWWRFPVVDLDFPHIYLPSDTPGHAHLYLDRRVHYVRVLALMTGLWAAGFIERGHWIGHLFRGYSAVRLPWVRKDARICAAGRGGHGGQHRDHPPSDR